MNNVTKMTRTEFRDLTELEWDEGLPEFDALVILPERYYHDSGFRCMSLILCKNGEALCKIGGGTDAIHIDGIGGLKGYSTNLGSIKMGPGWTIDCLPKSGLLCLFCHKPLKCSGPLSSFEIWTEPNE